ncbi:MAG: tetratricopeptide repeat protein [Verrucomicrobia bacterium]|nr:tetratricopeptide repeat protein [Verrucomicrobiota bacterium]
MKKHLDPDSSSQNGSSARVQCAWLLIIGCAFVILIGFPRAPRPHESAPTLASTDATRAGVSVPSPRVEHSRLFSRRSSPAPAPTAQEIVAGKLSQFARSRREFAHALARRHGVEVSDDVERFFTAVESGVWEEIDAAFNRINGGDSSAGASDKRSPAILHLWPAIIDAYGAAEQVHDWPAQKLLDYGNAVLGSLRPGMVYVGGTDNGRWIPELLNDTSDGERHIIITQNGLADSTYLEYLWLQYDDRLITLSQEESERAFQEYVADAEKRLRHDQEFPDEPKQIRPGEDIRSVDGKIQVSGQAAVMAINEKLLQTLMAKNPDLSFALQESFPLKNTYADALPLGPLMELRAQDGQNSFTPERAAQSLDYWRNTADQVLTDPAAAGSAVALRSYSHDTVAAANLLAAHGFLGQAEQAYRLAAQLWPGNPESAGGLADILGRSGREQEARQILADFTRNYPDQREALERFSASARSVEAKH